MPFAATLMDIQTISMLLFSHSVVSDSLLPLEQQHTRLQASLSFTISWSFLKLMSIKSVMPSDHLILCRPRLLLPSIFPSIRVFSSESAGQSIGASALASVLPILGINSLSVGLFTNTLFHSAACLCVLFMVSFAVQNLLSLIGSPCLVLFFFPWDTGPRKYCYDICQRTFCLCSLPGVLWGPVLNLGL